MTLTMPEQPLLRWLLFAGLLLAALVVVIAAGRALIRQAVFPRPAAPADPRVDAGVERVWLGESAKVEAWFLAAETSGRAPTVIFAHGNGELIDHWRRPFTALTRAGIAVLLVEYPGYGRSGGAPSEASIRAAMVAAYDWLGERPGVDSATIYGYGRSMGGGAVCALAAERRLAGLILESSFTRLSDIVPAWLPSVLVSDTFDNAEVLRTFAGEVLVLHGRADRIIPITHGEALARSAGVPLVAMECGHNDCQRPWREILAFIDP